MALLPARVLLNLAERLAVSTEGAGVVGLGTLAGLACADFSARTPHRAEDVFTLAAGAAAVFVLTWLLATGPV
jgi:uncharacterized membrane protein